jgi:hypothetical protein
MRILKYGRGQETGNGKQNAEAQEIFPNPFTVCKSCKRKFVVCPFVDDETNGSYPFANGLTDLPITRLNIF